MRPKHEVLDYLAVRPGRTYAEIAFERKLKTDDVKAALESLLCDGKVRRVRGDGGSYWFIEGAA